MSKEEIVAAAVADIQSGQQQVLVDVIGSACDKTALEQKAADGTMSQADVDAKVALEVGDAVKAAVDPLNQQISDLGVQMAAAQSALSDLQASHAATVQELADMTAKEQLEEQQVASSNLAVADVKVKIDSVQAAFDAIRALLAPVAV